MLRLLFVQFEAKCVLCSLCKLGVPNTLVVQHFWCVNKEHVRRYIVLFNKTVSMFSKL